MHVHIQEDHVPSILHAPGRESLLRHQVIDIHIFISGSFLHQEGVNEALEGGKSVLSDLEVCKD